MPARDLYHHAVRNALIKDGWTITHDPYTLSVGLRDVYIDLGAERVIAAERGENKIAVEVKTFQSASDIHDLEMAIGQYALYRSSLSRTEPERVLFLAVPQSIYDTLLEEQMARYVLEDLRVALVAFDPAEEVIIEWKTV
jgi:hypothetical protein